MVAGPSGRDGSDARALDGHGLGLMVAEPARGPARAGSSLGDLTAEIDAVFSALTVVEVTERLQQAKIAYARRRDVKDVLQHPQLDARGRWTDFDSPVGPIRAVLPVITLADRPPRMDRIPDVGEHTESILSWLALDVDQRADAGSNTNDAASRSDSR